MCHVASHRNWKYQIFFGTYHDRCLIAVPAGVPTPTRTAAAVSRPASAWGRAASSSTEASSNLPSTPFLTLHPQVLDIYPFEMLVATIFTERRKAFKLILFREYLHCTLYSKLLNMTKGWQKFTGCWRNRIFISKYNYFVHLKCWIIWISAISSLLCWDITRRFSCKCLASKFVPLQGISNYLKLPRGSSACSSDVLVKWWNCCNIHFEHLNIIHLNCALFSNIQIKCVEGLETGEILSLEDEISHLQKENSRIENQLSRMKGDVNTQEADASSEEKVISKI